MPEKANKMLPALSGGIIMGVIGGVPFLSFLNCFCCAGVLLGGLMSVFFYNNELTHSMPPLTSGDSLQLGVLAGIFGAVTGTVIHALLLASFGDVTSGILLRLLRNMEGTVPPEALDQLENSLSHSAGLGVLSIVTTFFFSMIIYPLFGLLGGLIGYSIFKPKLGTINMPPPTNPPAQTSL